MRKCALKLVSDSTAESLNTSHLQNFCQNFGLPDATHTHTHNDNNNNNNKLDCLPEGICHYCIVFLVQATKITGNCCPK